MIGIVKWFSKDKAYGFICPDDGLKDIFVHQSDLVDVQILIDGQKVEFELERGPRGLKAKNVKVSTDA